jgi:hypothetical protein
MLGTLSAEAQPVFTDGRLNGCTVVFGALAKDFTYKQGGYITVNGSFGIMSAKAELAATLKVVVGQARENGGRTFYSRTSWKGAGASAKK